MAARKDALAGLAATPPAAEPTSPRVRALTRSIDRLEHALRAEQRKRLLAEQRARKRASQPRTHLVIPDAHADLRDEDNDRFDWVGRLAAELKPDLVIQLGDAVDFPSLSTHDPKGGIALEGRRIAEDFESGKDAWKRMTKEILRPRGYKPDLVALDGNHEERVPRATARDSIFQDYVHLKDLGREDLGWSVCPYTCIDIRDGVAYSHEFRRPNTGRAIAGLNQARAMLQEGSMSCVAGHAHTYKVTEGRVWDGRKTFALVAGCYFERAMKWAGPQSTDAYWRGCFVLRDVVDGYPLGGIEPWPMDRIRDRFGG